MLGPNGADTLTAGHGAILGHNLQRDAGARMCDRAVIIDKGVADRRNVGET